METVFLLCNFFPYLEDNFSLLRRRMNYTQIEKTPMYNSRIFHVFTNVELPA